MYFRFVVGAPLARGHPALPGLVGWVSLDFLVVAFKNTTLMSYFCEVCDGEDDY